jgi:VIT1/CCC1 family predicted Fe2+/Mn2+ transporter
MNTALWIVQVVLAIFMLMPGSLKLMNSIEELIAKGKGRMDWAEDISATNMKIIGLLEVLAAIGLILPMAIGFYPILTPLAAVGVILTMIGAISLHLKRGDEPKSWMINVVIILLAVFVTYGRYFL